MKALYLIIVSSLLSASAWAADFVRLNMALTLDGKASASQINVEPGKEATLSSIDDKGSGYEIWAGPFILKDAAAKNPNLKKSIAINFKIYDVKDGKKKLLATPSVITVEGMTAKVSEKSVNKFDLAVTPTIANSNSL